MIELPKIEVLSADEPKQIKLNWKVYEYIGFEITKKGREGILTKLEDLKPGDVISQPDNLCGAVVEKNADGNLYLKCGRFVVTLHFAEDDRKCWTTGAYINLRAIKKLELFFGNK